jgi:hypothetical protein
MKKIKIDRFSLALFILFLSYSGTAVAAKKVIQPNPINSSARLNKTTEIEKGFENQFPRFEYFLQEITNFVDTESSIYFYNYINPTVLEQASISNGFNILRNIRLLKNIDKSPKERAAMRDIERFLNTNFETQRTPSYAFINNPQLPKPLYLSQLADAGFRSIKDGNIDTLHALVNNYNLLDSKDEEGNAFLATTIMFNRNNMTKLLITSGADINAANNIGMTPLMLAARAGNYEAADLLIKRNCNLTKLDLKGMSALDYAKDNNKAEIYSLLQSKLKTRPKIRRR